MMKYIKYIGLILVFGLTLIRCSKENSKKWLVVDITTTNNYTGLPIENSSVSLCYYQYTLLGSYAEYPVDLGSTDDNGYLHIEWEIPKKAQDFKINIYPAGVFGPPASYYIDDCSFGSGISVSPGNLNVINRLYDPWARYNLHYINQNCFDQSDSVVVEIFLTGSTIGNQIINQTIYGCADTLLPYQESAYTPNHNMEIEKHIYRNGTDTIIYQNVSMDMSGNIQTIEILY